MGPSKFRLFINENSDWLKAIGEQSTEIPVLTGLLEDASGVAGEIPEKSFTDDHFKKQLFLQKKNMEELNAAIEEQQKRLEINSRNVMEGKYDVDTLCTQDILRDRIRAIEKNFIELKCNFMKYLSSLL
jgi:hypothetical protein